MRKLTDNKEQLNIEIEKRKQAEQTLKEQLHFEQLLSSISARFINVPFERIDEEIRNAMQEVLNFFEVDRFTLLQTCPNRKSWIISHSVSVAGVPPVPIGAELPVSMNPWAYEKLVTKREALSLSNIDDAPAEANEDKKTWIAWGVRSILTIPILVDGNMDYMIAIHSVQRERFWPEKIIPKLRLLGEIFVDALERKRVRLQMDEQLRFERLISNLSSDFVNVRFEKVDNTINEWLRTLVEFFSIDRCSIGLFSDDATQLVNAFDYHVPGSPPAPVSSAKDPVPWYIERLREGTPVIVNRLDDLPPEAEWERLLCIKMSIKSILCIPLMVGGSALGSLVFVSTYEEKVWPEHLIPRLRLVGEVFANILKRKKDQLQLEEQLKFEMLLSDISGRFVNLPVDQIDSEIEDAQRRICECLGLHLSVLWQWSAEIPRTLTMTHLYRPLGGPPPPEPMCAHEYFPWSQQQVEAGRIIVISSLEDYPADAVRDKETSLHFGVKSNLTFPLSIGGNPPVGVLTFNTMLAERTWSEPLIKRLQLVAEIFIHALIRKQNETALRESERRLSLATEGVGVGLWSMDIDKKKVWVSPKSRDLFHFAPDEEITYESYFRVIHPEDRDRVHQDVQRALQYGEILRCEYRIILPDGTIRWIAARGQRFLKSTGEPDRLMGLALDITERKEMEEAIRKSDEKYRLTFSSVSDVIYTIDPDLRISSMTPNVEKILGYKVEELINRPFPELYLLTPESLEKAASDAMRVLSGEQISASVYEFIAKDGTRIFGEISGSPLIHEGKIIGITSVARNITERKKIELQLSESQTLLSTLVNSTPDLIWSVDAEHFGLLNFNRGLYDYFLQSVGLHIEVGMRPEDLFKSKEYVQIWHSFYQRLLSEGSFTTEYGTYRGNRTLRMNFNILKNDDTVFGISVFAQDITELKKMETQLRKQLVEIEKLKSQLEKENIFLREEIKSELGFGKIIGSSDALQYVLFRAQKVAPTDATVLILGETGVGKGMVAYAIHEMSTRKDKPMITVNCAALPANLIESELFGREKGAFTGAHARQVGRFEIADGGTIFLDEIGELPLELQAKLLRVLQDGEFERLGSPKTVKVNVRVIASTSRDLKAEMAKGRFREDLYYRLNVFPVSLPPLRMRVNDIPELAAHFIDKYAKKFARRFDTISKDTIQALQAYHWPGNVRELEHLIERAVITSTEPIFQIIDHLEQEPVKAGEETLYEFDAMAREHILQVLQKTRWKIEGADGAAAILGLKPSTLRFRIKKLGITRP